MSKETYNEILINIFLTFALQFIAFFITKYFILVFGSQLSGLLKLFAEIIMYLGMIEAGLMTASTYALYKPLSEKNKDRINILISTIHYLYNKVFIGILILGIIITPLIPYLIKDNLDVNKIYLYWILYVVSQSFSYTLLKYCILFTADNKFLLVRYIQSGTAVLVSILQGIILWKFQRIEFYIVLPLVSVIIQKYLYKFFYNKYYQDVIWVEQKDFSILKNLRNLIYHKLALLVLVNTDIILISMFVSLEIIVVYGAYKAVNSIVLTFFDALFGNLRPQIGRYIAENQVENNFILWNKLHIIFFAASLFFAMTTYFLVDDFITLWLGKDFLLSDITKVIIYFNLLIELSRRITEVFKEGYGFFDDIYLPISEACINLASSVFLVQLYGIDGVLIGTLLSNIIILCIAKPIIVFKRCFGKSISYYLKIYIGNLFSLFLFLLIISLGYQYFNNITVLNWGDWIWKAVVVSLIVASLCILVLSMNKVFRNILINFFKGRAF